MYGMAVPSRVGASRSDARVAAARRAGVEAERLRVAMGLFATGVTVVTTRDHDGRPFGTTANAVASVSLSPSLVLVCLREESETLAALLQRRRFAINVLHSDQGALSDRFARRTGHDTWQGVPHDVVHGIPLLRGAIATLECELHDVADGGDHVVVVGHVVELAHAPGHDADPLLFYAGSYRRIGEVVPQRRGEKPTEVALPSRDGPLRMLSLSDDEDQTSVAVLTGDPRGRRGVLVYAHVPCLFGDVFGSTVCSARTRLRESFARMRAEGQGATVYHREPGAGPISCGCAEDAVTTRRRRALSDGALEALSRALATLELTAVRLMCDPDDGQRAVAAGLPIAELVTFTGGPTAA
jgi:3-hydroxy-9,10-secoandrosta-1,3,5(10)-triene-9,17-dione monooxygenase reductase component